ncbi:putative RNA-binding protein [Trypanosoma theileri]|uniref:Putative RNA-binding protein n=1 Tax=Trypanosoma theileri TaxID=67003 RepID=A0A1X0NPI1_9TRYP|nr:putative RNA-binding protein [Trypanosoma theileri]ORC86594.1 putative RNA-binding protein [Trypanosoma theileri]
MRVSDPTAASTDGASHAAPDTRYFVGGVQRHITQQDLERYFGGFGPVESLSLKRDAAGNSRGYGWVIFRSPPQRLERQEPHVLKGVKLTVEKARSRGPSRPSRPGRRRSRSRSLSPSSSASGSSSESDYSRRGGYRRGEPRGSDRGTGRSDARARLPPLTAHPGETSYTMPPPPPPPPNSIPSSRQMPQQAYNTLLVPDNRNSSSNNSGSSRDMAAAATETYLCIPLALCPPEYLNDPRTFCAKLDQSRVGSLNIVPTPPASAVNAPTTLRIPPNSGAPTLSSVNQQLQLGSMGNRSTGSNNSGPPSLAPTTTMHMGLH